MKHTGIHKRRLNKHNPREVAFSEAWKEENKNIFRSDGTFLLQKLMFDFSNEPKEGFYAEGSILFKEGVIYKKIIHEITQRDAEIVATVIQWLGSNCGLSFLDKALKMCNKKIVDIDNE